MLRNGIASLLVVMALGAASLVQGAVAYADNGQGNWGGGNWGGGNWQGDGWDQGNWQGDLVPNWGHIPGPHDIVPQWHGR